MLVALVVMADTDPHGKKLIDELSGALDTGVSPGTIYPGLHRLHDNGVLKQHELVQTKVYSVADQQAARDQLVRGAQTHLLLGRMLHSAAAELGAQRTNVSGD